MKSARTAKVGQISREATSGELNKPNVVSMRYNDNEIAMRQKKNAGTRKAFRRFKLRFQP